MPNMNNDFNYKKDKPLQQATEQPQPVVVQKKGPNIFRKFFTSLLLLVLLVIAVGGIYMWQQNRLDDAEMEQVALQSKIATLESKLADVEAEVVPDDSAAATPPASAQTTSSDLIPGDTDTRRDDGRILVDAIFKYSLKPTELWVEYGTDADKIDKATVKITKGLGLADTGTPYSHGFSAEISDTELEPGKVYYYRTAATVNGQTLRSAIASFVTDK